MYMPITVASNTASQYSVIGNLISNSQMGIAARLPRVPGAFCDKPLPKPNASNNVGDRSSSDNAGFLSEMGIASFRARQLLVIYFYILLIMR